MSDKQVLRKNLKVLVVEDHEINLELMLEMLERLQCDIDTAENGKVAVEKVKNNTYDVIFMDMQMPVMGGIEATEKIFEMKSGKPNEKIIALTANAMSDDKVKCFDAGMDDYLSKPFELCDIENILTKYFPE